MPVVRGSCLCGGVKYEITGPLMRSGHCHCSNCRKAHGAAFRSRARVHIDGLDDDPGVRPERHFFVSSKAPWFEITDELPQHAELPPRSEVPGA